jgi:hypothetical protein
MLGVVSAAGVMTVVVALVGSVLVARQRAGAAADLAALAAASASTAPSMSAPRSSGSSGSSGSWELSGPSGDGCAEAGRVAGLNGARLLACSASSGGVRTVLVAVTVGMPLPFGMASGGTGGPEARARARAGPAPPPGPARP